MGGRRRTVVRTLREGCSATASPNDLITAAGERTGDTDYTSSFECNVPDVAGHPENVGMSLMGP
jgi:hypothetical protein